MKELIHLVRLTAAVSTLLSACHHPAQVAAGARDETSPGLSQPVEDVVFDGEAVRGLINWVRSASTDLPSEWRSRPAYALTREWARWSGQPDPDSGVAQVLAEVIKDKATSQPETRMAKADALQEALLTGRQEFLRRALPHLRGYLPPGTALRARVLFAAFIPPYAFAWGDGSIVINLTAGFWSWSPDKVFNLLVHELYHIGFGAHCQGSSPQQAETRSALVESLLWQTQNEGMATYVAYRVRPQNVDVEDYRLLDDSSEVRLRFRMLQKLLDDAQRVDERELAGVRDRLWSEGTSMRAFYVVGASMARSIEAQLGREALVRTVIEGPAAFLAAYMSTSPSAELALDLSGQIPSRCVGDGSRR